MPPEHLVLEITERTLLQDEQQARTVLTQLNAIGIRVSIDDYGTGYSSLASLRQLPIQQVKIDRCFVTGIPTDTSNDAIVRSTDRSRSRSRRDRRSRGRRTTSELQRLAETDCDLAQGYLIGRPLPADELAQLVVEQRRARQLARTRSASVLTG